MFDFTTNDTNPCFAILILIPMKIPVISGIFMVKENISNNKFVSCSCGSWLKKMRKSINNDTYRR
jgi:hypothetical protein